MIIALPMAENQLCLHFGHCERFAFFEVDEQTRTIKNRKDLTPPPHEPGILPPWIKAQGASLVITGGMGSRAQNLFKEAGVQVITGAPSGVPEDIVMSYLNNSLVTGRNACDH